jgi:16S rRNA (guanine527-N7)-methyltransferase
MKGRAEALAVLNVSRETVSRLDAYAALLEKWNPAINLVAKSTLAELWTRHILDSAQLFDLAPLDAKRWADLGAGGGFPGLVIAILAAEKRPELKIALVESDARKAAFLQAALRETGLAAEVIAERIEKIPPLQADVVSARALAPLPKLLAYAERHLAEGGVALFPKGAGAEAELSESLERWQFSVQKHPSRTDQEAAVLRIGELKRA